MAMAVSVQGYDEYAVKKEVETGHPYLVWLNYLLFTPLHFLLAWGLEKLVDSPSKHFANDLVKLLQK